jgi:hypothetical protein
MLITILKRLGGGTLIGATIALFVLLMKMYIQLLNSWTKLWERHLGVHIIQIAHAAYHTLQVELLNAHHAIHVEVLSVHHVMQVDVTRHHQLWLRLNGILTFGDLIIALGMFLVAASIWTSARATSISLLVKSRQMTNPGPGWHRDRFSAHNARYFLPDSRLP